MNEPNPWYPIATIIGVGFGIGVTLIKGLQWLFSRPSNHSVQRMHQENIARDELRRKENTAHYQNLSERLFALESPIGRIDDRLRRAEQDILDLREWKHTKGDPYIGAVEVLKTRVDALQREHR